MAAKDAKIAKSIVLGDLGVLGGYSFFFL